MLNTITAACIISLCVGAMFVCGAPIPHEEVLIDDLIDDEPRDGDTETPSSDAGGPVTEAPEEELRNANSAASVEQIWTRLQPNRRFACWCSKKFEAGNPCKAPSEFKKMKATHEVFKRECKQNTSKTVSTSRGAWKKAVKNCICAKRAEQGDPCVDDATFRKQKEADRRFKKQCRDSHPSDVHTSRRHTRPTTKQSLRQCICDAKTKMGEEPCQDEQAYGSLKRSIKKVVRNCKSKLGKGAAKSGIKECICTGRAALGSPCLSEGEFVRQKNVLKEIKAKCKRTTHSEL